MASFTESIGVDYLIFYPIYAICKGHNMAEKKYQIFVSSTFKDLQNERMQVLNAITNMKHLAAGMELFCASNDEQFKYIKRVIDDSDYYVLIVGTRYGSVNPDTGFSYTEMEFDYAVEKGIPILAFIKQNAVDESEDENKDKLSKFIEKVQTGRLVKYWNDLTELQGAVYPALIESFENTPRQGWQRFENKEDRAALLEEINTLRKSSEELKTKYFDILSKESIDDLSDFEDTFRIRFIGYRNYGHNYDDAITISWAEIFKLVGPHIVAPIASSHFKNIVEYSCVKKKANVNIYDINDEDYQTIKYQLSAYGLIKIYVAQSVKNGLLEYIELTDKGRLELLKTKVVRKQAN